MRLQSLLPYIALLSSSAFASPLDYANLRRHEDSNRDGKQFITTVMVFTKTMVLEIDYPPATSTSFSTQPIPPPAESTPPTEKVTVTQVVTVTKKRTSSVKPTLAPSTTEVLSRLNPFPTTEKKDITETSTTPVPGPGVTEKPSPPPEEPTHQLTSSYTLSRLKPSPDRPDRLVRSTTLPEKTTTMETTIAGTTTAKTTTTNPAPTSTPQPERPSSSLPSSSLPDTPTPTGFVPPTDPPYSGPFLKENVPVAIKRNQEFNEIKEGDDCDPATNLLACAGTMGKAILQCGANKKYKSVLPCLRDNICFATPRLMGPGVMVTCDTPKNAGKKFNMSPEELLKEIQGKDNQGSYKRKRRQRAGEEGSSPARRAYSEVLL